MSESRVQKLTKYQLESVKEEEEHTSIDSVIKSLLKERTTNSPEQ